MCSVEAPSPEVIAAFNALLEPSLNPGPEELFELVVAEAIQQVKLSVDVVERGRQGLIRHVQIGRSLTRNVRACGQILYDELHNIMAAPRPAPGKHCQVWDIAERTQAWMKANGPRIFKARNHREIPVRETINLVVDWLKATHLVLSMQTKDFQRDMVFKDFMTRWPLDNQATLG